MNWSTRRAACAGDDKGSKRRDAGLGDLSGHGPQPEAARQAIIPALVGDAAGGKVRMGSKATRAAQCSLHGFVRCIYMHGAIVSELRISIMDDNTPFL